MADYEVKQNDTWPPITFVLTDRQRTISSISKAGSTVTVLTSTSHGMTTGDFVYIYGTVAYTDDVARSITVTGPKSYTYADTDATAKATEATGTSNRGVNLTTATSVKLIARKSDASLTITGVGVQSNQATAPGEASYTFLAADTATIGTYDVEFEVSWGGSPAKIETFPNSGYKSLQIFDDLG